MEYSVYSDAGTVRTRNEDCCFAAKLSGYTFFAVVCDGMGGENAGDIASLTAMRTLVPEIVKKLKPSTSPEEAKGILLSAISEANRAVYDRAILDPVCRGMGTTVVAAYVCGSHVLTAHAGDSRAYTVNSDTITQVTKDHSLVREMVDSGVITEEEAETHPDKNLITRALGVQSFIDVEFTEAEIADGGTLILCSDGLSNYVSDDGIKEIIASSPVKAAAEELTACANKNGGGDNITAVVFRRNEG